MVRILGISAYYHDSAAALVEDGRIVCAVQEERFTRVKGDASLPHHAIGWCLDEAGIDIEDVDHVVFYEQPIVKFERLLTSYLATAPRGLISFLTAMPSWLTSKLWLEREISRELGIRRRVWFCTHHLSHAASAFFPSPFEEAAILTIDGVGEWSTATWGVGRGSRIELTEEMRFPNSLGLLYSAFTYYCGFKINSGEYKLMGLAPYGQPRYAEIIKQKLVQLHDDGSLILNQRYFNYVAGLTMTGRRFHDLLGGEPRRPESKITEREMDLAASVQQVVDEAILRMGQYVYERTGLDEIALAGGVALNCVATGRLSSEGPFRMLWTQPAAGDAGGALGAALWFWHHRLGQPRTIEKPDAMLGAFLGPRIEPQSADDDAMLCRLGASWESVTDDELQSRIAEKIAAGKVVAIARGSMEFGPRALGARSILGDARSPSMQSHMNLKVKFRESFRPFAPMVLAEDAEQYFDVKQESPYMLLVYPVQPQRRVPIDGDGKSGLELLQLVRSDIPAVTHVDYSARVQTVDPVRNLLLHGALKRFRAATGCSVIINTSFNVRGEPIVNTAEDAYRCWMATEIDCLVVGNRWLERDRQQNRPLTDDERKNWLRRFDSIDEPQSGQPPNSLAEQPAPAPRRPRGGYLRDLALRREAAAVRQQTVYGLVLGWVLTLVGGFVFFCVPSRVDWLWGGIMAVGIAHLAAAVVLPQLLAWPERLWIGLARWQGWLVMNVLLTVVYFTLIWPAGYLSRRRTSGFVSWDDQPPPGKTAWQPIDEVESAEQTDVAARRRSLPMLLLGVIAFFIRRGNYLIVPIIILLLVLGLVLYFVQSSALAPFIYTLF